MRSPADAAPGFVHVPDFSPERGRFTLSEDESHYVARVCRAREGDAVSGTDGRGMLLRLRVVEVRKSVTVDVEAHERASFEPNAHVFAGAPEGQRADWMVEKLAELGIRRFTPIECERSGFGSQSGRIARWRRLTVAALKQSQAAFLMEVEEPRPFAEAVAAAPEAMPRWWAHPGGGSLPGATERGGLAVIGPSRGFSDRERKLLEARLFTPVRLARTRLRTETAAVAWAAWWARAAADS